MSFVSTNVSTNVETNVTINTNSTPVTASTTPTTPIQEEVKDGQVTTDPAQKDMVAIRARINVLMNKLSPTVRRDITRFVDANRHRSGVGEVESMEWTAEAMELMAKTGLSDAEKKELVTLLYQDLSDADTNDFREAFKVDQAVEFIINVQDQKYGIKVNKTGCLSSLCCTSASVVVDVPKKNVDVKFT